MNELLFHTQDHIAIITFNRPAVLNVFRRTMFEKLLELLDEVARNNSIRVVLLTGAGRAFSAGIDLDEISHLLTGKLTMEHAHAELSEMQELSRRMVNLPKPIVSAINGLAIGAGAEVAIASDIRIASENATFAFAEVRRGLLETNGVMHRLPRMIGMGRAAQLMLTGEIISARSAQEMGLVARVVPPEMLISEAMDMAHTLAANSPISTRLIKEILQHSYDLDLEAVMQLETKGTLECLTSEDLQEGVQAFMEKREPNFKGK
ncbi:MAG: enoyl-CoA hydratase/isomerase family protein [Chloroflexota bacterium]